MKGGEAARVVVALGGLDDLLPGIADDTLIGDVAAGGGQPAQSSETGGEHVVDAGAVLRQDLRLCRMVVDRARRVLQRRENAEIRGVIGDRQEVEWRARKPVDTARSVRNRLPLREEVGVVRRRTGAEGEGVVREHRVDVQIAEVGRPWRLLLAECDAGAEAETGQAKQGLSRHRSGLPSCWARIHGLPFSRTAAATSSSWCN